MCNFTRNLEIVSSDRSQAFDPKQILALIVELS